MAFDIDRILDLAQSVEDFELGNCGPSDDPDKQTAYLYAFKEVAKRFVSAARRLDDPELHTEISALDLNPASITDAYDLRADLVGVIDLLREKIDDPAWNGTSRASVEIVDSALIARIASADMRTCNPAKLVQFATELNENYRRGNYLSCALLIRAIINHVPPLFGVQTFAQVVAQSGRSVKALLARLQEEARDVGDLHSHEVIDRFSSPPTSHQVEPYRPSLEVLFKEIERKLGIGAQSLVHISTSRLTNAATDSRSIELRWLRQRFYLARLQLS